MTKKTTRKNISALVQDRCRGEKSLTFDVREQVIKEMYHLAYATNRHQEQFFLSQYSGKLYARSNLTKKDIIAKLKKDKKLLRTVLADAIILDLEDLITSGNATECRRESLLYRLLEERILKRSTLQTDFESLFGFNKEKYVRGRSIDLHFYLGDSKDYVIVQKSSISQVLRFCETHPDYRKKLSRTIDLMDYKGIL